MEHWLSQLGPVGYPLAACSLLAGAVVLERIVFFVRALGFQDGGAELKALLTSHKGEAKPARDELVQLMLLDYKHQLLRGIRWLKTIGMLSPLLGLLGTVLGMIVAFQAIAEHAGPVNPALVADGLWEAMLTTAVGLVIALPSLLAAHLFTAIAETHLHRLCLELNRQSLSYALSGGEAPTSADQGVASFNLAKQAA